MSSIWGTFLRSAWFLLQYKRCGYPANQRTLTKQIVPILPALTDQQIYLAPLFTGRCWFSFSSPAYFYKVNTGLVLNLPLLHKLHHQSSPNLCQSSKDLSLVSRSSHLYFLSYHRHEYDGSHRLLFNSIASTCPRLMASILRSQLPQQELRFIVMMSCGRCA